MYFSKKLIQLPEINHCFFSKNGGTSENIYKSLNCGHGSKDSKINVKNNLKIVSKKIGVIEENLVLMNQTHSNRALIINKKNNIKINSDAMITQIKGLALGVLTADCVPMILYDKNTSAIGCVHAGWKGCLSGIIENTISKFKSLNQNNEFFASIGPCIGKNNYEVGQDLVEKFAKKSTKNLVFFQKKDGGKFLFDIRAFVNSKLRELGVNHIDNIELDTFQEQGKFYSYRRSQKLGEKDYGRCISIICLI